MSITEPPIETAEAFSTTVTLTLHLDGHQFELAQAGPTQAILRQPQLVPIGPAKVIMTIDGRVHSRSVRVTDQDRTLRILTLH